ncbi:MAG TPA: glycerol kinase GlpK [Caldisericia bacterium]|nr:glycerol kinase GlpK [Caldisericia bacterium]HQL66198.1 glycerol kinase GlpK [Caldisericia bacterium]HQP00107.1 glycerol kinase GlpK [Caldisericia bacterium]
MKRYILVIDQGTTTTRCIIFNNFGEIEWVEKKELRQIYPNPGWVEHNPDEIWDSVLITIKKSLESLNLKPKDITSIGITNQRETTIIFDRETGKPLHNAIVWQCRRSDSICEEIKDRGLEDFIHKRTGLVVDPYFSLTKLIWLLRNNLDLRKKIEKGEVGFGTVDTFLLYKLTKGKSFSTDFSNASRTMMFNINSLKWDEEILNKFDIPKNILPDVKMSSSLFGITDKEIIGGQIPITSLIGDQQASLFGQLCLEKGTVKNTYGTGSFILMNTGEKKIFSKKGLLTTIAWGIKEKVYYALEGSVFISGAVVQWLRDGLKIINSSEEVEELARSVDSTDGSYFVPAFVGLGTPYWDMYAGGLIIGITRKTTKAHIALAAIESIAFQTKEVIDVMENETKEKIKLLRVDGGASTNNFLLQKQADFLNINVERPKILETTAFGAFLLSGLGAGVIKYENLKNFVKIDRVFKPSLEKEEFDKRYKQWKEAVSRSLGWRKVTM